jgi:hypothetical protein
MKLEAAVLSALLLLAGCASGNTRLEDVPLSQVLAGPYELRLSVIPTSASPGESVAVTIEFENTGQGPLWVPRNDRLFLNFRGSQDGGGNWSSTYDARSVRLGAGKKLEYTKNFQAPDVNGPIQIFLLENRSVHAVLEIRKQP